MLLCHSHAHGSDPVVVTTTIIIVVIQAWTSIGGRHTCVNLLCWLELCSFTDSKLLLFSLNLLYELHGLRPVNFSIYRLRWHLLRVYLSDVYLARSIGNSKHFILCLGRVLPLNENRIVCCMHISIKHFLRINVMTSYDFHSSSLSVLNSIPLILAIFADRCILVWTSRPVSTIISCFAICQHSSGQILCTHSVCYSVFQSAKSEQH